MRHRVAKVKLNRDMDHMEALLKNLSTQLILSEKVDTTLAKAKGLRSHVEKLVTYAIQKNRSEDKIVRFNAVKHLNKQITMAEAVKKLLDDIAVRFESTAGGYTRIVKTGNRDGDNAPTARIEFTKQKKEEKKNDK